MRSSIKTATKLLALAMTAAAVTGCTAGGGLTPVSNVSIDNSYSGDELGYAAQFGPVPVYARGGPFDDPRNVAALVAVLNRNHTAQQLEFAAATAAAGSPYSVVFSYGQLLANANYCDRRADVPVGAAAAPAQVVGSFCLPSRLRAQATLTARGSGMPTQEELDALVSALFSPDLGRRRGRAID